MSLGRPVVVVTVEAQAVAMPLAVDTVVVAWVVVTVVVEE